MVRYSFHVGLFHPLLDAGLPGAFDIFLYPLDPRFRHALRQTH